jgi:hypothetical protein
MIEMSSVTVTHSVTGRAMKVSQFK